MQAAHNYIVLKDIWGRISDHHYQAERVLDRLDAVAHLVFDATGMSRGDEIIEISRDRLQDCLALLKDSIADAQGAIHAAGKVADRLKEADLLDGKDA